MNLTLAITTYNRLQYLRESFAQVINHPRITEIILMDDSSDLHIFQQIEALKELSPKIKVHRQARNRGMSRNKADAVSYAENEWVILFDSDNVIGPDYVDAVSLDPNRHIIYQPSFAKPHFDFRKYEKFYITGSNAGVEIRTPMINTMLNACNYLVNRDEYLRVYEENTEQKASDTIWMAYLWIKAGNSFYVAPGMEYYHRVHNGSGFLQDADYNFKQADKVKQLIMQL